MIELNKIYNEDCLVGMNNIEDKSIDMIICDLPYGTTECAWDSVIDFKKLWEQYNRIIKKNGSILLFGSQPFTTYLIMSNIKAYKCVWYWQKEKGVGFTFAKFMPLRQIEEIVVFCYGKSAYNPKMIPLDKPYRHVLPRKKAETLSNCNISTCKNGDTVYKEYTHKYPTNLLMFPRESSKRNDKYPHPTKKPLKLVEYLIETYSKEGDVILDNCMGSGTTAIACLNLKRQFIGFELNQEYFNISIKRIADNKYNL